MTGGRPKRGERAKILQVRASEAEMQDLRDAANKAGVSVSDYVRLAVKAALAGRRLDVAR